MIDEENTQYLNVKFRPLWWRCCPFKIRSQLLCWAGFGWCCGCCHFCCCCCCYYQCCCCLCCCSSKSRSGSTHGVGRMGLLRYPLQQGKNIWLGRPAQVAWGVHTVEGWDYLKKETIWAPPPSQALTGDEESVLSPRVRVFPPRSWPWDPAVSLPRTRPQVLGTKFLLKQAKNWSL